MKEKKREKRKKKRKETERKSFAERKKIQKICGKKTARNQMRKVKSEKIQ